MAVVEQYDTDALGAVSDRDTVNVSPLRILATVAACIDAAEQMAERGSIEPEEIDDTARAIGYRILTRATREAREAHTWWHAGRTTGDTERHSPVPDPMTRVRARTRQTRSNSGVTVNMVTVHGRAYVQGASDASPSPDLTMSADRATRALQTVPRASHGADAIGVYRMTQALYGDSIPRLIGADVLTFHEFRSWDEVRSATPRRGYATRFRLPTVRARNGETCEARATFIDHAATDTPTWSPATVREVLAPDIDPAYAWRGYRRVVRPDTVRAQRASKARKVTGWRNIGHREDPAVVLADVAEHATIGDRVAWQMVDEYDRPTDMRGFLTVTGTDKARFSVTGLPEPVRNYATTDGLAIAVARAIAS